MMVSHVALSELFYPRRASEPQIRAQIGFLRQRLGYLADSGECAYEKMMAHTYRELLDEHLAALAAIAVAEA